ncbi:Uncharacterised protein [uncultured archaeon]|nr:Uncharacterised protein [uncultured archaeon]
MKRLLGPTGALLVGATFIYLFILLSAYAEEAPSGLSDLAADLKESLSGSHDLSPNFEVKDISDTRQLRSPIFLHQSGIVPEHLPRDEKVSLNETHPTGQVADLTAMNSAKERDVFCEETQNEDIDGQKFSNFLDASVSGTGEMKRFWSGEDDNDLEKTIDNAFLAHLKNDSCDDKTAKRAARQGNNMNIEVRGISVSAINTVEGGSTVATSNIIIKPVQIIICPPEVEEKLK